MSCASVIATLRSSPSPERYGAAAGWRVMRLDEPMTIHDAAMHRFAQWWNRAVRSGMGYIQAWRATRGEGGPGLYGQQILRAVLWAGGLPLASIALAVAVSPWSLLLWPALTLLQLVRLAPREGLFAATLAVAGKFAELRGIMRYLLEASRGDTRSALTYK